MDITQEKKNLRANFIRLRAAIENRKERSQKLTSRVFSLSGMDSVQTVFCFVGFGDEPDTLPLIQELLKAGKTVCVPRIEKIPHMEAVPISEIENLERNKFGILEPPKGMVGLSPDKIEFTLTPGLAFDNENYRLGYGGGYYDSFFAKAEKSRKIGIAFKEQQTDSLPRQPWDIPLDGVIFL